MGYDLSLAIVEPRTLFLPWEPCVLLMPTDSFCLIGLGFLGLLTILSSADGILIEGFDVLTEFEDPMMVRIDPTESKWLLHRPKGLGLLFLQSGDEFRIESLYLEG